MTDRTPIPADLLGTASGASADAMTEPQADFIAGLLRDRDIPSDARAQINARLSDRSQPGFPFGNVTKSRASNWIQRLKAAPKGAHPLPARGGPTRDIVAETRGRYTVSFRTLELDGGKVTDLGFVQVGDTEVPQGKYALDTSANERFTNDITFFNLFCFIADSGDRAYSLKMYVSDDLVKFPNSLQSEVLKVIAADPAAASALYGQHKKRCGICNRKLTNDVSRERGIGPVCATRMSW
jgi:hypothetical protein